MPKRIGKWVGLLLVRAGQAGGWAAFDAKRFPGSEYPALQRALRSLRADGLAESARDVDLRVNKGRGLFSKPTPEAADVADARSRLEMPLMARGISATAYRLTSAGRAYWVEHQARLVDAVGDAGHVEEPPEAPRPDGSVRSCQDGRLMNVAGFRKRRKPPTAQGLANHLLAAIRSYARRFYSHDQEVPPEMVLAALRHAFADVKALGDQG